MRVSFRAALASLVLSPALFGAAVAYVGSAEPPAKCGGDEYDKREICKTDVCKMDVLASSVQVSNAYNYSVATPDANGRFSYFMTTFQVIYDSYNLAEFFDVRISGGLELFVISRDRDVIGCNASLGTCTYSESETVIVPLEGEEYPKEFAGAATFQKIINHLNAGNQGRLRLGGASPVELAMCNQIIDFGVFLAERNAGVR